MDLVIICLGLFLSDPKTRTAFMNQTTAVIFSHYILLPMPDGPLSNLILAIYFMSKVASSREYLLFPPVNIDRHLIPIMSHENAKIKANVNRVYKNLNSDLNEAIEEGAVATLIAMSLEVRCPTCSIMYNDCSHSVLCINRARSRTKPVMSSITRL